MFMGKLLREWLQLQPSYNDWKGNNRPSYIRGASLKRVNDHTLSCGNNEMQMLTVHKHIFTWRRQGLQKQQENYMPSAIMSDSKTQLYFHPMWNNTYKVRQQINSNNIFQWIAKPSSSVRRAGNSAMQHTRSILKWLRPPTASTSINSNMRQWETYNLVHDAYAKKKKIREPSVLSNNSSQPRLIGFLSLRQALNKNT